MKYLCWDAAIHPWYSLRDGVQNHVRIFTKARRLHLTRIHLEHYRLDDQLRLPTGPQVIDTSVLCSVPTLKAPR